MQRGNYQVLRTLAAKKERNPPCLLLPPCSPYPNPFLTFTLLKSYVKTTDRREERERELPGSFVTFLEWCEAQHLLDFYDLLRRRRKQTTNCASHLSTDLTNDPTAWHKASLLLHNGKNTYLYGTLFASLAVCSFSCLVAPISTANDQKLQQCQLLHETKKKRQKNLRASNNAFIKRRRKKSNQKKLEIVGLWENVNERPTDLAACCARYDTM